MIEMRLFLILLIFPSTAFSGYYEIGFSGSYRKLHLPNSQTDEQSFDATTSYSGSFAYYFAEMTAAQINFTKGQSERFVPGVTVDSRTLYDFSLIGLDLIFTFAERKDPFIPYLKAGVAYFAEKNVTFEYTDQLNNVAVQTQSIDPTFVPSLGLGIKFRLTNTMAVKLGIEAWTSDSINAENVEWDFVGRAGISWFL